VNLGEVDAAINTLHQATDFYPENSEIEYRLAGAYYFTGESLKGAYHLENALKLELEYHILIELLFPYVYHKAEVQEIIKKYEKASQ
ncbi:MAG TPA: hypothetical protein VFD80_09520, partial [Flavobacteriaceae bacterium]|nr:hypothetical protein [Flavobacteriaceae bacterium]